MLVQNNCGFCNGMDITNTRINEPEDRSTETPQTEIQREKKKYIETPKLWGNFKNGNKHTRVLVPSQCSIHYCFSEQNVP